MRDLRLRYFPGGIVVKNLPANAGDIRDLGSAPRLGRSLGGGHGNPLQYSACSSPHSIFIVVDFPSLMDHSHQQKNMLPYLLYLKISSLDLKNSSGYCRIFLISFASKLLEAFSYSSPLPLLTSSLEPTPPNLCHYGSYQ